MSQMERKNPVDQWKALAGEGAGKSRWVPPIEAMRALDALSHLQGKPGLLVLDDLTGAFAGSPHDKWKERITALRKVFEVCCPVLPVHRRHAEKGRNADDLLPIIKDEIQRLRRPLAAVVDMQWEFCDRGDKNEGKKDEPWFGLELVRLIKRAKPSLPIFVWSPIQDKHVLQRAMQLGASSCFDKPGELRFNHDLLPDWKPDQANTLDAGKLWFRLLEWEIARYQCPPVGAADGDFILAETPETVSHKERFLKDFSLNESELRFSPGPPVVRLLRALVPGAEGVEILRFFGEGQSGLERPFVVRGRAASGRWLRPVQIKLSKDWRALSREGKGYRDVFAGCLGPSVAHVLTGPYRLEEWCGMSQSFAAPEEAIRDISSKSTRSLESWLRKKLPDPDQCCQLVDDIFDGVLDPLYKGNLSKRAESVIKTFDRVSPPHLERTFLLGTREDGDGKNVIDLNPARLSRKGSRARREAAYRAWRRVEEWWNAPGKGEFTIRGMEIESLKIEEENPPKSRLRLLDPTLGIKVDLFAGDEKSQPEDKETEDDGKPVEIPALWRSLGASPIKLVGTPVSFSIRKETATKTKSWSCLLAGWTSSIRKSLEENGLLTPTESGKAWTRVEQFFHSAHPIDWSEEFHVGPTHGDLNLGNILLHQKGDGLFPWLIDFDKAEDKRPVVFDLAKLEIEAYHKIAQELFWELLQTGSVQSETDLRDAIRRFEQALATKGITDTAYLWERFRWRRAVSESLKNRFSGLLTYLKQVRKRVEDLDVTSREFLIGRTFYALCCLKFKHLYQAKTHSNAPFPAQVLLFKLEALLDSLDAENGIISPERYGQEGWPVQQRAIHEVVQAVRTARCKGESRPLGSILGDVFRRGDAFRALESLPFYNGSQGWERLLRLLRDKQVAGKNMWIRELLWYARDFGVADAKRPKDLARFIEAMVQASQDPRTPPPAFDDIWDYASTGRLGNVYPALEMFTHLADDPNGKLIKISSRGESGGTIDILEEAGIPICKSRATVDRELGKRRWAVVETSEHLCEVDNLLMDIRRRCHCMKVGDLVMASISAKKAALGIANFKVQVVCGYDAKFAGLIGAKTHQEAEEKVKRLGEIWQKVWKEVFGNKRYIVTCTPFESETLESWAGEIQGRSKCIVFGKTLLAANIWRGLGTKRKRLQARFPVDFCKDMDRLATWLCKIQRLCSSRIFARADDASRRGHPMVMDLTKVGAPAHIADLRCFSGEMPLHEADFREMRLVVFRFCRDVRSLIRVDYLDCLLEKISESGHPLASLLFGRDWMAVLAHRSDLPADLQAWCWRVLRDGFRQEPPE